MKKDYGPIKLEDGRLAIISNEKFIELRERAIKKNPNRPKMLFGINSNDEVYRYAVDENGVKYRFKFDYDNLENNIFPDWELCDEK